MYLFKYLIITSHNGPAPRSGKTPLPVIGPPYTPGEVPRRARPSMQYSP
jgi:hypothetical protein